MLAALSNPGSPKNLRVIIYGGGGFIGSRLALYLHHQGCHVTVVDHDNSQILLALKGAGIEEIEYTSRDDCDYEKQCADKDVAILMAGNPSVRSCTTAFGAISNSVYNLSRFLSAKRPEGQVVIYASSSSVYGDTTGMVDEDYSEYRGHNYYDICKKSMDLVSQYYISHRGSKDKIYGVRMGTVCGWSLNLRSDVMVNAMAYSALTRKKVGIFVEH
ncbi:hypothetical protein FOZ62_006634, partial [Perkinsus olseni]